MKAAVVVPTNRPERLKQFFSAWCWQFYKPEAVRLIVVEDAPTKTFALPEWVEHYCHGDIFERLGDKASCIPTKSGGIRDFGFWLAGKDESIDMIVSLDDDVLPITYVDFLAEHWRALETPQLQHWWPVVDEFSLRGFPYGIRDDIAKVKPMLNHGLWQGFPDIDAVLQMSELEAERIFRQKMADTPTHQLIPRGYYFTLCGMNFACRREVAPFIYFPKLPNGLKRWDDIWMGVIFKRIADLFGWAVTSGEPQLHHERASDPINNLRQEFLGYGLNEQLWKVVDSVDSQEYSTPNGIYLAIAYRLGEVFPQLAETAEQMKVWASLWDGSRRVLETSLPSANWIGGEWRGGQFVQAPAAQCMHGGWRGVPEKGVYDRVAYDWQCSECKRWFPKDH